MGESIGIKVQRHKPSQTFNRYRTVDRPAPYKADASSEAHPTLPRTRIPRRRPRYSVKHRTKLKQHEPPEKMKQYEWKPWKKSPENPLHRDTDVPKKDKKDKKGKTTPKQLEDMRKVDLVWVMQYEHPTVTLDIGTVSASLKKALKDQPD